MSDLGHVQLPLVLGNLLPQLHHSVSLTGQLSLGFELPSPGELSLSKTNINSSLNTTNTSYLDSLPGLPSLHSLIESVFDSSDYADVVVDQLRQEEEVVLGLLLVDLLHLLLHVGQLLEGGGQLGVVLSAAKKSETLAKLVSLPRQAFPEDTTLSTDLSMLGEIFLT